jgi:hypothetical protein
VGAFIFFLLFKKNIVVLRNYYGNSRGSSPPKVEKLVAPLITNKYE